MTCIVGMVEGKKVYIGSDSLSCTDTNKNVAKNAKVFRGKTEDGQRLIIGGSGSWRMLQLLEFVKAYPKIGKMSSYKYLVTQLVPAVRKLLVDAGIVKVLDNQETTGEFLIGFNGQLFLIQEDWAVLESGRNFEVIGMGEEFATGALLALGNEHPRLKITKAIQIASQCSVFVGGKIKVISE